MRIAVDAMGGDHAPEQIVLGAIDACERVTGTIVLVGPPDRIGSLLPASVPKNLDIHPASEVIGMEEKPIDAIRKKRNSTIVVGCDLVKQKAADAFVSAGNTGAVAAAALLAWRQVPGVRRPAILQIFPSRERHWVLLDAGASPDVEPAGLVEFAEMGRAYCEKVMGRPNPGVHLLNIGEEEGKGNAFTKEAYRHLHPHPWFRGNIEPKDAFRTGPDVVVCDAFVGNLLLKTAEGVAEFVVEEIKGAVPDGIGKIAFLPLKSALKPLKKRIDYAEYGGSPLLGLNGIAIISHGRSNARAISNAIVNAAKAVRGDLVQTIFDIFHRPQDT